jgi:hypothetical protein
MNGVMIIPTGIGCEIGGHAGDATPAARLLASVCDKLIVHPNIVNASDINEMTDNMLYVEGSMLDRFLEGRIELKEVKSNKILVAVNEPPHPETINAVSAARATLGIDASIIVLKTSLDLIAIMTENGASGEVYGWVELVEQVKEYKFDALALATPITIDNRIAMNYFKNGGINPLGGVEAKASRLISIALNKPVAHAPVDDDDEVSSIDFAFISDPRMAAEIVSWAYLHCVLKGLHKAPRIGQGLSVKDIDFMVTPVGCFGKPHHACLLAKIPVIAVKENSTYLGSETRNEFITVDNYLEATGVIAAMKAGVLTSSVRRPIYETKIFWR